jgi:hypothetical protein
MEERAGSKSEQTSSRQNTSARSSFVVKKRFSMTLVVLQLRLGVFIDEEGAQRPSEKFSGASAALLHEKRL